jgi:DNA-directed RNA polymerase subunit RPC12/RpoP
MTMAKCHKCGREVTAPYDGQPYWCTACSYEDDLKEKQRRERKDKNNER